MNADALTEFLHRNIPLTVALGARVVFAQDGQVQIQAPLDPNLNHHGTAFGGSLAVMGILAGWVVLHQGLQDAGIEASLVVRHTELDYLQPVTGELVAYSELPSQHWPAFAEQLRRGRRARIDVSSVLRCGGVDAVNARGTYVALPRTH